VHPKEASVVFLQINTSQYPASTSSAMASNLESLMSELDDKNQGHVAKYRASHWTRKYRNDVLRAACLKCQIDLPSTATKAMIAEAIVNWVRNSSDDMDIL
jgi:hypothetical protein